MASRMQIGQAAQRIERAHQEGSLVSDLQLFLGTIGNKDPVALSSAEAGIHGSKPSCM
jgi:hypothetical protein